MASAIGEHIAVVILELPFVKVLKKESAAGHEDELHLHLMIVPRDSLCHMISSLQRERCCSPSIVSVTCGCGRVLLSFDLVASY